MVDNIIKGIVFGLLAYVWFYLGTGLSPIADGAYSVNAVVGPYESYVIPNFGYWFFSILAFAMARGK